MTAKYTVSIFSVLTGLLSLALSGTATQASTMPRHNQALDTLVNFAILPQDQGLTSTPSVSDFSTVPPSALRHMSAAADDPTYLAQVPVASEAEQAEQLRQQLRVDPLTSPGPERSFPPSPNAGIPSGFGASGGDAFASATLTGADRVRPEVDGSLSFGFGFGNPRTAVGVEVAYNLLSVRRFGENGSFDVKVHRYLLSNDRAQLSAAIGWNSFASYGSNASNAESSPYGVVTGAYLLQPDNTANRMPITATVGVGGGSFSPENSDVGVIAGVGLQVDSRLSLNTAWSGVGLNLGASVVPISTVPLTMNFLYGDVTNETEAGSVAVFTLGYGFNFGPRF